MTVGFKHNRFYRGSKILKERAQEICLCLTCHLHNNVNLLGTLTLTGSFVMSKKTEANK